MILIAILTQTSMRPVPVNSKLQHPPRATPRGIWILENFCSNPPLPEPKSCSKCPHPGKIARLRFYLFGSFYCASEAVYLNIAHYRQHPNIPRDSGHISYKHIKSNIVDELTSTSRVAAKIIFINWINRRFYVVSCNNTSIHSVHSFYYLYTYICMVAKCTKLFINTPGRSIFELLLIL